MMGAKQFRQVHATDDNRVRKPQPLPPAQSQLAACPSLPAPALLQAVPDHPTSQPLRQGLLVQMQRQYGNAYVQQWLKQNRNDSPPVSQFAPGQSVQRCGGAVHSGCPCAEEEAAEQNSGHGSPAIQRQDMVPGTKTATAARPMLRRGSRGPAVEELQGKLNSAGATPPLVVDGIFGPKTQAAVITFQQANDLKVDGIVGPQTWGALESAGAQELNSERVLEQLDRLGDIAETLGDIVTPGNLLGFPGLTSKSGPILYGLLSRSISGPLEFSAYRLEQEEPAIAIYSPLMTANGSVIADASVPVDEYEIGFVQTLIASRFTAKYIDQNGRAVRYLHIGMKQLPIRDGKAGFKPWMRQKDVKSLKDDYIVNTDDRPRNIIRLRTQDRRGSLSSAEGRDNFCTWLAARHKPSGQMYYLGWATWEVDWGSAFDAANETGRSTGAGGKQGAAGDKKGPFTPLEDDPVANDSATESWSATP